jgi:predicted O-methyltransferase YrrM
MKSPQMIVGLLEGAFLKMMAHLAQATRVLEIVMFTITTRSDLPGW